jgi:hypothetical protein
MFYINHEKFTHLRHHYSLLFSHLFLYVHVTDHILNGSLKLKEFFDNFIDHFYLSLRSLNFPILQTVKNLITSRILHRSGILGKEHLVM